MLLLIDIGNTNITIGFHEDRIREILRIKTAEKGDTVINELKKFLSLRRLGIPNRAIMCSVVPSATTVMSRIIKGGFGFKPLTVRHDMKLGLKFCIQRPEELGTDRIASAVAASRLYRGNVIIADFGTATTLGLVSSRGEYKGGSIMPGIGISAEALSEKTARLKKIRLKKPVRALGDNTENNILSGLIFGHAGAVERVIKEMKREYATSGNLKIKSPVKVIATGGNAELVTPYIKGIKEINPLLTLEGLRIIYELNV
jgi:type III pantothenate kinase